MSTSENSSGLTQFQCYSIEGFKKAILRKHSILNRIRAIMITNEEVAKEYFPEAYDGNTLFGMTCHYNDNIPVGMLHTWAIKK